MCCLESLKRWHVRNARDCLNRSAGNSPIRAHGSFPQFPCPCVIALLDAVKGMLAAAERDQRGWLASRAAALTDFVRKVFT